MHAILTVDDSSTFREMVGSLLRKDGYSVSDASDGLAALEMAKARNYDLILTDQAMPLMDGLTLIQALRQLPQYKETPILMITTAVEDDMKAKGKSVGATGWLIKPFDPEKLLEIVKQLLEGQLSP